MDPQSIGVIVSQNEEDETMLRSTPRARVNPKLRARAIPRPAPPPDETPEMGLGGIEVTNPRLHLLHNGIWVPKDFPAGRLKDGTGRWTCCGSDEHLTMYCESLEARLEVDKINVENQVLREKEAAYKKKQEEKIKGPWERGEVNMVYDSLINCVLTTYELICRWACSKNLLRRMKKPP